MEKKRELFHAIFNYLNNISVMAGSIREEMSDKDIPEEQRKLREESAKNALAKIEDHVSLAAKTLEELRGLIKSGEDADK